MFAFVTFVVLLIQVLEIALEKTSRCLDIEAAREDEAEEPGTVEQHYRRIGSVSDIDDAEKILTILSPLVVSPEFTRTGTSILRDIARDTSPGATSAVTKKLFEPNFSSPSNHPPLMKHFSDSSLDNNGPGSKCSKSLVIEIGKVLAERDSAKISKVLSEQFSIDIELVDLFSDTLDDLTKKLSDIRSSSTLT